MSSLWLPFAGAFALSVYGILCTLYQHSDRVAEVLTALFSGPRAPRIRAGDHWRTVHRAADRRAPFVTSDTRALAPADRGKRA
jgi:hypothetical protein